MRSRIMSALVATAAAGATATTLGLAAAGAANASVTTTARPATIGTPIGSTNSAGYEVSGRDYRYISSTITVPDTSFLTGLYPQEYIQLSNGSLTQVTGGGNAYNSLNFPSFRHFFNLAGVNQGDGVNFSIYYNEVGNELSYVITPPSTSGTPQFYKTGAHGSIFDHAAALDDFTDSTGTPIALPPFIRSFRINQFLQGAITTENGARGSFTGPWTTSEVVATSNGLLPPSGTTRVSPSALWTDGLPANGAVRANDAFGVWAR
jgi:hypothetical protein